MIKLAFYFALLILILFLNAFLVAPKIEGFYKSKGANAPAFIQTYFKISKATRLGF